jgi:hypothetical protein
LTIPADDKPKIRAIRLLPVKYEMTSAERRELRRRYELALPNPFDPDFPENWLKSRGK